MNSNLIFFPVLIQIILTIALYITLNVRKKRAAAAGQVDESRRGLFDDAWPVEVIKVNNCIRNQFEVPVLFYILSILLWALHAVDLFALIIAWLFAVSRISHALVHTGPNHVPTRRRIFMFGTIMVLIMTLLVTRALFGMH